MNKRIWSIDITSSNHSRPSNGRDFKDATIKVWRRADWSDKDDTIVYRFYPATPRNIKRALAMMEAMQK